MVSVTNALDSSVGKVTVADPRFKIAAGRRMLHRNGLDSQVGGHVSVRAEGDDAFWVTPMQYFDETLPSDVRQFGFDLEPRDAGGQKASLAISFHSSIYRARPDVNCVIHVHSENVAVLSTTNVPFGIYHFYAAMFYGQVASTFQDVPGLSPHDEAPMIAEGLGENRAIMVSHHGSIHAGSSIEVAVIDAICFELCAGRQVAAMAIGGKPMDDAISAGYKNSLDNAGFHESMWAANLRRLRRTDPDLFDTLG